MKKRYIIDTNFLARILIKDNQSQLTEILDFIDTAIETNSILFVDRLVTFELFFILTGKIYQLNRLEIYEKLTSLLNISCFTFENRNLLEQALEIYKTNNLDFTDCFLIARSLLEKSELQTFDKQAQKVFEELKIS
jgi:predicted nucleic-acid-binding protein